MPRASGISTSYAEVPEPGPLSNPFSAQDTTHLTTGTRSDSGPRSVVTAPADYGSRALAGICDSGLQGRCVAFADSSTSRKSVVTTPSRHVLVFAKSKCLKKITDNDGTIFLASHAHRTMHVIKKTAIVLHIPDTLSKSRRLHSDFNMEILTMYLNMALP